MIDVITIIKLLLIFIVDIEVKRIIVSLFYK